MRIAPGGIIGIVGGGQLGRMLAIAAAELGYRCHVLAPDEQPPAGDVAACFTRASFDDTDALRRFAGAVDVVTYEFENLSVDALAALGSRLRPGTASLAVAQDRATEKTFVAGCGARVTPWRAIDRHADLAAAADALGLPLLLKSRRLGYDGKGQALVQVADELQMAWQAIGGQPAVAEQKVAFDAEFSVLLARSAGGSIAAWDIPQNLHEAGILRRSTVPAGAKVAAQAGEALATARAIAERLDHVGVLTVEFFATADGPLVNEIAPRVHNSGHWTIEGSATSQFAQHIRAICGLPLGSTERLAGRVTMDNLIGDELDDWPDLLAEPGARLHLYRKGEARPGRKMGHVTRLGQ